MKRHEATQHHRFQRFTEFLEEHAYFSPQVAGDDTVIDGFQVGDCFLMIEDMEWLFTAPADLRVPRLLAASNSPVCEA